MEQTTLTMGKRIAANRKRLKMTQDALAQELGVSAQAVSKWENDLSCPDITMLPGIAKIFGITVDELLGVEAPAQQVHEAQIVPELEDDERGIHFESDNGHKFDIHFGSGKRASIAAAAWFIAMGAMMLAGLALQVEVGLWSAAWMTGLTVFGIYDMVKHVRVSNVVCALAGVYFIAQALGLIGFQLGWNVVLPVLIVILGVSLLIDGLTKKNRSFHITAPETDGSNKIELKDGVLTYNYAFDDSQYLVRTPELKSAQVNVSFGDLVLDFSGVEALAQDCRVRLNSSYGDIRLRIPSRFQVNLESTGSFSEIQIQGQPDPNPQGVLRLVGNTSFGDLEIQYI